MAANLIEDVNVACSTDDHHSGSYPEDEAMAK
jgi:hypothetical protein